MKIEIKPSIEVQNPTISNEEMKKVLAAANYLAAISGFSVKVEGFKSVSK